MSLLSVIVDVCGRQGLVQPTTVVGNTDRQVTQLLSLANQAGRELARDYAWQALIEEQDFTTTAAGPQVAALPADFDRFVPDSFFNRTTMLPVQGPLTAQQWQALQAFPALGAMFLMYRERQGQFLISPTPPAGQTIAYEYVSLNWCQTPAAGATAAVPRAAYQADTDVAFLDETLIADSLEWRYLAKKGLSYAEEMATFERNKEKAAGRDGGAGALTMGAGPTSVLGGCLPPGNWPVIPPVNPS